MSDKSEIEAIRAVKRYDIGNDTLWWSPGTMVVLAFYFDRLLAHVDALEARVAQLEGAQAEWFKTEAQFYGIECRAVEAGDRMSAVQWMDQRLTLLTEMAARLVAEVSGLGAFETPVRQILSNQTGMH